MSGSTGKNAGCRSDAPVVAYAFLTRYDLPLWPVWSEYFRTCPPGSFTVVMHTQQVGPVPAALVMAGSPKQFVMIPANESFKGNLRFSWDMVAAMLSLYRHAAHSSTRNCAPSWVHLSSEQCAPITNCQSFHESLARRPKRSRLQQMNYMPWWSPAVNASVTKVSQWSTLWMAHATALAADEERLRLTWKRLQIVNGTSKYVYLGDGQRRAGALDEYVWAAELERRGLPFDLVGPTYYSFHAHMRGPEVFTTREAVARVAQLAQKRGMYFARKFGYEHAVQSELLNAVRFTARPQGEIATR